MFKAQHAANDSAVHHLKTLTSTLLANGQLIKSSLKYISNSFKYIKCVYSYDHCLHLNTEYNGISWFWLISLFTFRFLHTHYIKNLCVKHVHFTQRFHLKRLSKLTFPRSLVSIKSLFKKVNNKKFYGSQNVY